MLLLVVLLLAVLAIVVSFILLKHTRSQTARVITVLACVFILWDLGELYFDRDNAIEIQNDFSNGVQEGLDQEDVKE